MVPGGGGADLPISLVKDGVVMYELVVAGLGKKNNRDFKDYLYECCLQ